MVRHATLVKLTWQTINNRMRGTPYTVLPLISQNFNVNMIEHRMISKSKFIYNGNE